MIALLEVWHACYRALISNLCVKQTLCLDFSRTQKIDRDTNFIFQQ